jgi:hypothetical protein
MYIMLFVFINLFCHSVLIQGMEHKAITNHPLTALAGQALHDNEKLHDFYIACQAGIWHSSTVDFLNKERKELYPKRPELAGDEAYCTEYDPTPIKNFTQSTKIDAMFEALEHAKKQSKKSTENEMKQYPDQCPELSIHELKKTMDRYK